ncbi:MAG: hypothetical protein ABH867_04365 [Patescibacteria group bacterium]|nr:hypothetical protein [Patescibacteria group bacterium]
MREIKVQDGKITLIFKKKSVVENFILKELSRSLKKARKFFELSLFPIKIYLLDLREDFDRFAGKKTAAWEVGRTNCSQNTIYLLSPSAFESDSIHKKRDFPKVLTHELIHLFTHQLYPFYEPHWLREGLAYFVADQGKANSIEKLKLLFINGNFLAKIDSSTNWRKNLHKGVYQASFLWVSFLLKKFGKKKILSLLRETNFPYERAKFAKVFQQVYQQNLYFLQKQFAQIYLFQDLKRKEVKRKC